MIITIEHDGISHIFNFSMEGLGEGLPCCCEAVYAAIALMSQVYSPAEVNDALEALRLTGMIPLEMGGIRQKK